MKNKNISKEIEKKICEKYIKGKTNKELSEEFNIHRTTILRILKRNNIELRSSSITSRKNFIINFNGDILTTNDAYILGLIWSDGNLSRNCIEIVLQESDRQILDDISKYVYNKDTLTYRKPRNLISNNIEYKCKPQVRFRITSKDISNKLRKIGLKENKSLTCNLPILDEYFIPHFIRGLLDGDGNIYDKNKKNYRVSIVTNHIFCNTISKIVNEKLDINSKVYNKTKNVSMFTISGRLQILKFLDWIYNESDLKLNRKYRKYINLK